MLCAAGVLSACGANETPQSSVTGGGQTSAATEDDRAPGATTSSKPARRTTAPNSGQGTGPETAKTPGTRSPATTSVARTASGPSCAPDAAGDQDASGSPAAYSDLTGACLRSGRAAVVFEATFAGAVPASRCEDGETLSVGWVLPRESGNWYVAADCEDAGWTAYLTRGEGRRELPGAVAPKGATVRVIVPLAALGDVRSLRWQAETSWVRSGLVGTAYAFDKAPDAEPRTFHR